jgi:hypothetical protein
MFNSATEEEDLVGAICPEVLKVLYERSCTSSTSKLGLQYKDFDFLLTQMSAIPLSTRNCTTLLSLLHFYGWVRNICCFLKP